MSIKLCENCLYAKRFKEPKLPLEPSNYLLNLCKRIDALLGAPQRDSLAMQVYKLSKHDYDHLILCHRYPTIVERDKNSFCGEFVLK